MNIFTNWINGLCKKETAPVTNIVTEYVKEDNNTTPIDVFLEYSEETPDIYNIVYFQNGSCIGEEYYQDNNLMRVHECDTDITFLRSMSYKYITTI
jgi:hypothetical protein